MPAAGAGHAACSNLPPLGEIAPEQGDVLVVDVLSVMLAEQAGLSPEHGLAGACPARRLRRLAVLASLRFRCHGLSLGSRFRSPCEKSRVWRHPTSPVSTGGCGRDDVRQAAGPSRGSFTASARACVYRGGSVWLSRERAVARQTVAPRDQRERARTEQEGSDPMQRSHGEA